MRKLTIYANGDRFVMESGINIVLHQGEIRGEYDLSHLNDEEFQAVLHDPRTYDIDSGTVK